MNVLIMFVLLKVVNEFDAQRVECGFFDHVPSQVNAWNQYDDGKKGDESLYGFVTCCVHIFLLRKMEIANNQESGECDEKRVDEEEVEGSKKIPDLSSGYAVSCGTKWWHQGGCDGNAGYDGEWLVFP